MANRVRSIVLSPEERAELERLRRASGSPAGLNRRARAVLLMADELSGIDVARRTGYTPVQASRIRRRFAEERLAGLDDRPRSRRPREVKQRKIAQVIALTLKRPPRGLPHWSARELADRTGLSHSTVHRIWQEHSLKPHRVETFQFSTDPEAEEKTRDVVGLYLSPPENAAVISLDEKTQIQALNRTQPLLPLRKGIPARQTHDYKRNGLTSLYAALDIERGKVIGECNARHTANDFLRFLKNTTGANCMSSSTTHRHTRPRRSRPGWSDIHVCTFTSPPSGPPGSI
jgi:transposase